MYFPKFAIVIVGFTIFLSLPALVWAELDVDDLGVGITKCFHPTAAYQRIEMPKMSISTGSEVAETPGKVYFNGGFTGNPYYMKFTLFTKMVDGKLKIKVTPSVDTAIFPPNKNCPLRDWQ